MARADKTNSKTKMSQRENTQCALYIEHHVGEHYNSCGYSNQVAVRPCKWNVSLHLWKFVPATVSVHRTGRKWSLSTNNISVLLMRKQLDPRIPSLITNNVKKNHRSFIVLVGDKGRDQVRLVQCEK